MPPANRNIKSLHARKNDKGIILTLVQKYEVPDFYDDKNPASLECIFHDDEGFKYVVVNLVHETWKIKNKIFGQVKAVVYTVEFKKRGLPHAHILLFISKEDKCKDPAEIDRIIFAEVPDVRMDPDYYDAVKEFMVHGPCGAVRPDFPCMRDGHCGKYFPKGFVEATSTDEEGYPIYRRLDNGATIVKHGVPLDSRYVVPHNRQLLLKYGAHINIEWCNQSCAIKYLFKYVNKGHDRATTTFSRDPAAATEETTDEIKKYYDCRYISPCEAAWRILGYEIQHRYPPVERLGFHLLNKQNLYFEDSCGIDEILNRATINESMFLAWFEANKKYPAARKCRKL